MKLVMHADELPEWAYDGKLGVNIQSLAHEMADAVAKLPKVQGQSEIYMSPALGKILDDALKEADQLKDE